MAPIISARCQRKIQLIYIFALIFLFECSNSLEKKTKPQKDVGFDSNDFAEFEDDDDNDNVEPPPPTPSSSPQDTSEGGEEKSGRSVRGGRFDEDDEREFGEFEDEPGSWEEKGREHDDDEEGIEDDGDDMEEGDTTVEIEEEDDELWSNDDDEDDDGMKSRTGGKSKMDLKITTVPLHLRAQWDSFYLEMLMIAGLGVYFLNFLAGRSKNSRMASTWLSSHLDILQSNFSIVGDDGTGEDATSEIVMKDTEHQYSIWCSGRSGCEGMLVQAKFVKRQDLVHVISSIIQPRHDQIHIQVSLSLEDVEPYVICIGKKNTVTRLHKSTMDLSTYCAERKSVDKLGLPSSFQLLSEIGEASSAVFDAKVAKILCQYEDLIDYIHISDQYSGAKAPEDSQPTKLPQVEPVIMCNFNVPGNCTEDDMKTMRPLLQLVLHLIDKVKRVRLSKEGKMKAERNRVRVEETFLRLTHQQRTDAAQARREEKRRGERERMLAEEDPEKQRKWEEREHKKEMKKRNPLKVKQMKVRAM